MKEKTHKQTLAFRGKEYEIENGQVINAPVDLPVPTKERTTKLDQSTDIKLLTLLKTLGTQANTSVNITYNNAQTIWQGAAKADVSSPNDLTVGDVVDLLIESLPRVGDFDIFRLVGFLIVSRYSEKFKYNKDAAVHLGISTRVMCYWFHQLVKDGALGEEIKDLLSTKVVDI
jgi:hypothetical protein